MSPPDPQQIAPELLGAGKVAGAVTALAAVLLLLYRWTRSALRVVILWACAEDVERRDTQHAEVMSTLGALATDSARSEERTAGALERAAEKLEDVAEAVQHITRVLVEKGLAGGPK